MKINLTQYHPIAEIQDNRVFASNGNLVLAYRIDMPEIYSLAEKDFEAIHDTWFRALRSLPNGLVVQKQDLYRKKQFTARQLPDQSFLQRATRAHFRGRGYLEHQCFLFFTRPRHSSLNQAKYRNPFRNISSRLPAVLDEHMEQFVQAVQEAVSFLNTSRKFQVVPLTSSELLEHCASYFNGFNEHVDTDVLLQKGGLQIGQNHFELLAVNNESCFGENVQTSRANPDFTSEDFTFHQGFIDNLGLDLEEDHIVNQVLFMDDNLKWRKLLEQNSASLQKSIRFGSQNKIILGKVQDILDRINKDESARVIRGHLNVIFWGKNRECLAQSTSKIKSAFKALDIRPHYPLGEERKSYFLNSFFCHASNFSEEDLYVGDLKHALCLLINNTNYKSDASGIIFNDRQHNTPVIKDVWDQEKVRIKARNFAIFAPTGEGKSFLANNILRQYYEAGVRLVIIDLGGSYSKFAQLYPEDHLILRYEQGKSLGINPFYHSGTKEVTPEHLEDLSKFLLELFAAGQVSAKGRTVAVKKLLREFYRQQVSGHFMQSFYDFVQAGGKSLLDRLGIREEFFPIENFLHILSEYVAGGLYAFLFENREDQSFRLEQKRLIIFELDEIRDNKEILSVMLKLIKSAIQRTIWNNRSQRGVVLFDEFAKQLKFENVLESVEYYYQAIRKQNGAIGIILQSINQLPENATSASILENTQVMYCLHNEKGYEPLHRRLHLSGHDLNQLKSIRNRLFGERPYTEVFIKIGRESNIFRLEVPPEVHAAYMTDGHENEILMRLYRESGSMEEAIKLFLTKN